MGEELTFVPSKSEKSENGEEEEEMMMAIPKEYVLSNMTDKDKKQEKRRILKNIILISVCWVMVLSAWGGLAQLQSSLHRDEGMGTINISILHVALTISSLLLPKPIIHLVGHKWAIVMGLFTYILWAAANGYAVWATMAPVSVLVGLASAPMWTAHHTYFTLFANRYALITNQDKHHVISLFMGIFFGFGSLGKVNLKLFAHLHFCLNFAK